MLLMFSLLLVSLHEPAALNNTTFFLLTRLDSKFDIRKAYTGVRMTQTNIEGALEYHTDSDTKFCTRHSNAR